MDRRKFLLITSTLLANTAFPVFSGAEDRIRPIRFGLITDLHYANRAPHTGMNRYYAESITKLKECVELMNEQDVDFLIQLGDLKDQGEVPDENETLGFLDAIEEEFRQFKGPRFHVLGNHDHDSISKQQFLDRVSIAGLRHPSGHYSFNKKSYHFVVLDANYTSEGVAYNRGNFDWKDAHVPSDQIQWLKQDLKRNKKPTIVFIHHRLDTPAGLEHMGPNNASSIRDVLDQSENVMAVFQGHHHVGDLRKLNHIHYYTLKAAIEGSGPQNNSYAIVEIDKQLNLHIQGYRKALSQDWSAIVKQLAGPGALQPLG